MLHFNFNFISFLQLSLIIAIKINMFQVNVEHVEAFASSSTFFYVLKLELTKLL